MQLWLNYAFAGNEVKRMQGQQNVSVAEERIFVEMYSSIMLIKNTQVALQMIYHGDWCFWA